MTVLFSPSTVVLPFIRKTPRISFFASFGLIEMAMRQLKSWKFVQAST